MRVEETFPMMREAPFGKDRSAARHDSGDALGGQRNVSEPNAGMDGEIIDALFALLDERVAVNLPGQLFGNSADLLQRLIDRHRANRHRRVTNDPFAYGVNMPAGGQVH